MQDRTFSQCGSCASEIIGEDSDRLFNARFVDRNEKDC